jgi:hypothetical protein
LLAALRFFACFNVVLVGFRFVEQNVAGMCVAPLRVCCCSPELPHDESMKFVLLRSKK